MDQAPKRLSTAKLRNDFSLWVQRPQKTISNLVKLVKIFSCPLLQAHRRTMLPGLLVVLGGSTWPVLTNELLPEVMYTDYEPENCHCKHLQRPPSFSAKETGNVPYSSFSINLRHKLRVIAMHSRAPKDLWWMYSLTQQEINLSCLKPLRFQIPTA